MQVVVVEKTFLLNCPIPGTLCLSMKMRSDEKIFGLPQSKIIIDREYFFLYIAVSGRFGFMSAKHEKYIPVFVFLVVLSGAGCKSYVPFTESHYNQADNRLDTVQFYISQQIVLRSAESEDADRKIREIVIPEFTEGILYKTEHDTMHIQFETLPSDTVVGTIPFTKTLKFGKDLDDSGNYVYQFSAKEIIYGGKKYSVIFHEETKEVDDNDTEVFSDVSENKIKKHYFSKTFYPLLLIDRAQKTETLTKDRREVPGIRIEDGNRQR